MVSKNIIPVGARSQKRWHTDRVLWFKVWTVDVEERKEHWSTERQREKKGRKQSHETMYVREITYSSIHIFECLLCVSKLFQTSVINQWTKEIEWSGQVLSSSLGEVHSRQRKEPVQRSEGRSLPSVFGEQEGGQGGGRK